MGFPGPSGPAGPQGPQGDPGPTYTGEAPWIAVDNAAHVIRHIGPGAADASKDQNVIGDQNVNGTIAGTAGALLTFEKKRLRFDARGHSVGSQQLTNHEVRIPQQLAHLADVSTNSVTTGNILRRGSGTWGQAVPKWVTVVTDVRLYENMLQKKVREIEVLELQPESAWIDVGEVCCTESMSSTSPPPTTSGEPSSSGGGGTSGPGSTHPPSSPGISSSYTEPPPTTSDTEPPGTTSGGGTSGGGTSGGGTSGGGGTTSPPPTTSGPIFTIGSSDSDGTGETGETGQSTEESSAGTEEPTEESITGPVITFIASSDGGSSNAETLGSASESVAPVSISPGDGRE